MLACSPLGLKRVSFAHRFQYLAMLLNLSGPISSVERVMEFPLLSTEQKEALLGANAIRILGL